MNDVTGVSRFSREMLIAIVSEVSAHMVSGCYPSRTHLPDYQMGSCTKENAAGFGMPGCGLFRLPALGAGRLPVF